MLKGKSAIVTGSTSGIGLGVARALAASGASVMLNGFGDEREIEQLRSGIAGEFGVSVAFSSADMSRLDQVRGMVRQAIETFGGVDILVNNAGIQHTAPVEKFPDEKWDAILAINLSACFHAIKAALPQMRERRYGRIVNVASIAGKEGNPNMTGYSASKAAVMGFTKSLAKEVATEGICVNAVAPAVVGVTPWRNTWAPRKTTSSGAQFSRRAAAAAIFFFTSSAARMAALPDIRVTRLEYEPRSIGVRSVSAATTFTRPTLQPSTSAMICAVMVSEPWPISEAPV
jgi:3-hydroxybutyrate dehydrogenase